MKLWIEALPGGRGQLHADVLDADGALALSWSVGSPAPLDAVQAFMDRIA